MNPRARGRQKSSLLEVIVSLEGVQAVPTWEASSWKHAGVLSSGVDSTVVDTETRAGSTMIFLQNLPDEESGGRFGGLSRGGRWPEYVPPQTELESHAAQLHFVCGSVSRDEHDGALVGWKRASVTRKYGGALPGRLSANQRCPPRSSCDTISQRPLTLASVH